MNTGTQIVTDKSVKRNITQIIFRIIGYMKPYWHIAALGIGLILANVFFNVKTTLIIKELTDAIAAKNTDKLYALLRFYVPYSLVFIFLMCLGNYIRGYVQNLISRDICTELYDKINSLPYQVVLGNHTGDLVSRVNKDVESAVGLVGTNVYSLVENTLICIVAFGYLSSMNLFLAFLVLMTGPVTFIVGRIFDKKIRDISKTVQDKGGEVRGVLQEFLQGMPVVRAFNMEKDFHDRFINTRSAQIDVMKKSTLLTVIMWRIVICTNVLVMYIIVYSVALSAIHGQLSIGAAIAFVFLMGRVQWPFINISKNWGAVQQCYGSACRIFDVLDERSEGADRIDSLTQNDGNTALSFTNVSFTYKTNNSDNAVDNAIENNKTNVEDAEKLANDAKFIDNTKLNNAIREQKLYDNLNLKVKKGEIVALVGPSGSGKTTLARMCIGLYMSDEGDVTVFNKSILSDLQSVRSNIAYVPQSPYLFAGTIKENIGYGKENAADEEIIEAAKAANAHEFIEKLDNGYDTLIGERGTTLSGGQRQRVAIARAFVKKAPLIILDEATSALDNESEYLVQQSMDKLMENSFSNCS